MRTRSYTSVTLLILMMLSIFSIVVYFDTVEAFRVRKLSYRNDLVIENETYYINGDLDIVGNLTVRNGKIISNVSGARILVRGNATFINSTVDGGKNRFSIVIRGNLTSLSSVFQKIGFKLGPNEGVRVENGSLFVYKTTFIECFRGIAVYNSSRALIQDSKFISCQIGVSSLSSTVEMIDTEFDGRSLVGIGIRTLASTVRIDNVMIKMCSGAILTWNCSAYISNASLKNNGNGVISLEGKTSIVNSILGENLWSNVLAGRGEKLHLEACRIYSSIAGVNSIESMVSITNSSIYNCGVGLFVSKNASMHVQRSSIVGCGFAIDSHNRCTCEEIYVLPKTLRGSYQIISESTSPINIEIEEYSNMTLTGDIFINNITLLKESRILNSKVFFKSSFGYNIIIFTGNTTIENVSFHDSFHSIHLTDTFILKNTRISNQLGLFVHGRGIIYNFSTESGLLVGVLGVLLCGCSHVTIEKSQMSGNALGILSIDSEKISIENVSISDNAFNTLFYNSTDIYIENSVFYNSFVGIATYLCNGVNLLKSEIRNTITFASFQHTTYSILDTKFIGGLRLGNLQSIVGDAYINETVGIISEFAVGTVERSYFSGLEKGIISYHSRIETNLCCFDNCLVAVKSNTQSVVSNSTFVAVGMCGVGNVIIKNSYFFVPESKPEYLLIDGAKIVDVASTPPVTPDVLFVEGNVTGLFNKTVIIKNYSRIFNAEFQGGVVIYDKVKIYGNIVGKNSVILLPRSSNVTIVNASIRSQKGIVCHTRNISVENVEFRGTYDIIFYNVSQVNINRLNSKSKLSVYARNSELMVSNSSFTAYHTCVADENTTINVVSSNYTWTSYRKNGLVYHSRWLKVNVLNDNEEPIESDVIISYDGKEKIYHTKNGKIMIPAPYSRRFLWIESYFNVYVTARNQYFTYPVIELFMDSDKEITLRPILVDERLSIITYSIFLVLIIFSLRYKSLLILALFIVPLAFSNSSLALNNLVKSTQRDVSYHLEFKPGDILLMGIGSFVPSIFSHAAAFHMKGPSGEEIFYESDERGAHGSYLEKFMVENILVNLRVKGAYPSSIITVLSSMRERVGFAYDPVWIIRTHSADRQYCSEYVYLAYKEVGIILDPLEGIWGWSFGLGVAPATLLLSQNVEVIWWL